MESDLENSLLTICKVLQKHNVQYMLIGGTAVGLNGYYRLSVDSSGEPINKPDIDIWYSPTYENYFNVLKVIKDLGKDITEYIREQNPDPKKSFFRYNFEDFSLDILPKVKAGIKFSEANRNKETRLVKETQIHFMSYEDLLKDKQATGRKKDFEDIEQLRRVRGER